MQLQSLRKWYEGVQDFESGKALYLSIPQGIDPSLERKLRTWQPSSFLQQLLNKAVESLLAEEEAQPDYKPEDKQLEALKNAAIALHEAHKKMYYIIQAARISNAKRLNLALDLLELSAKKRKAWDRHDHYKNTGELLPDPKAPEIDVDLNDAVAIHEKLVATNLNIFRHKNNAEKAALVQKHIEIKNYLLGELKQFKR
jgi:hypothetical protein